MSTRRDEIAICGLSAVRARFQRDAASIRRLYFDHATSRQVGIISRAMAAAKKIYRCVEPVELEKIAGTVHHGGIVAIVEPPALVSPSASEIGKWARGRAPVLVLDRIGNAHNLGALARTAAFFGVPHLVIPDHPQASVPNDAAYRVAEGGLEHVRVWRVGDLPGFLKALAGAGYDVVGAAAKGGRLTRDVDPGRPVALVLGNEEAGLDPAVAAACTRLATIPGSGRIESLNVSTAGAVLMHALLRSA